MSQVLLDTNVISELVRPRPEPRVVAFVEQLIDPLISALTLHELSYGAERAPDARRRAKLISWVAAIRSEFRGRIVVVDDVVAEHAGRIRAAAEGAGSIVAPIDSLIAACAASRGAGVVTRNTRDFASLGVSVIDPWKD